MKVLDIEEYDRGAEIHLELTEEEIELILEATDHKYYIESAIVHILEEAVQKEINKTEK